MYINDSGMPHDFRAYDGENVSKWYIFTAAWDRLSLRVKPKPLIYIVMSVQPGVHKTYQCFFFLCTNSGIFPVMYFTILSVLNITSATDEQQCYYKSSHTMHLLFIQCIPWCTYPTFQISVTDCHVLKCFKDCSFIDSQQHLSRKYWSTIFSHSQRGGKIWRENLAGNVSLEGHIT